MALSNHSIRNAQPKPKAYKLADSIDRYLYATPTGGPMQPLQIRVGFSIC